RRRPRLVRLYHLLSLDNRRETPVRYRTPRHAVRQRRGHRAGAAPPRMALPARCRREFRRLRPRISRRLFRSISTLNTMRKQLDRSEIIDEIVEETTITEPQLRLAFDLLAQKIARGLAE